MKYFLKYFFIYGLVLLVFAIIFSLYVVITIITSFPSFPSFTSEKLEELEKSDSVLHVIGGVKSNTVKLFSRDFEKYDTMHYKIEIIGFTGTVRYIEYRKKLGTEWIVESDTLTILPYHGVSPMKP